MSNTTYTNDILTAIVAVIVMDIIGDILFLSAMAESSEKKDSGLTYADTHPLVGRRYIPKCSDYATDRETGVEVHNLHGKEYIIVGNPFVKDGHLMVTIFSTDSEREYDVLFEENCIVAED